MMDSESQRIIGQLQHAIESMTDMWRHQEQQAIEGRRVLHDKFDEMREDMLLVRGRVDRLADEVQVIQPSIKVFNEEKLRAEGARRLGRWLWGIFLTTAGAAGWGVHEFVGWIRHP